MKNTYTFRKANPKDIDSFFECFSESVKKQFPDYSKKTRDHFVEKDYNKKIVKGQLKNNLITIYLAFHSKNVVAFLMVRPIAGGVGLANWIAVDKGHRGKGLASQLLKMWKKDAKTQGIHKLHLWTDKRNINFYKKRGFKLVGKIPQNYYGADDYLFYKSIQKPTEKNYLKSSNF